MLRNDQSARLQTTRIMYSLKFVHEACYVMTQAELFHEMIRKQNRQLHPRRILRCIAAIVH